MGILLSLSVAILAGLLMTRVFKPLKLPSVTAYLVAGVLIGPYCLGRIGVEGLGFTSQDAVDSLSLVSQVALAFIAFSIGSEFRMSALRKTGKQAVITGIFEATTASVCVMIALFVIHFVAPNVLSIPQVLTLSAIAAATAPAATLMVVRQYKAKGDVTAMLLPIVALDDAIGLIIFAVLFGIAKNLVLGDANVIAIVLNPLIEIVASFALGAFMGWVLTQIEKLFNSNTNRLNMTIAFVFMTAALSMIEIPIGDTGIEIGFSSLLVCMMLGTIFCNICPLSDDIFAQSDKWTSPLLALFFVISGAGLDLSVFSKIGVVIAGAVYILSRCCGKYLGAMVGSKVTGCSKTVQKYLGITLFPQAGVALGMCTMAMELGEQGSLIRNITLFGILIYELVGPLLTKNALSASGDIKEKSEEVKNRRANRLKELSGKK